LGEGVSDLTILHLSWCLAFCLTPFYRVNVCLLWENIVTNGNKNKKTPSLWPTSNNFYIRSYHCILLWNTLKILQRHGCISIMENKFAGKSACTLSYPATCVRYIGSNTGKSFSHPFLPCQCLFTFCVVWRINFRTVSHDQNAT
jgi:hypothetical protein